MYVLATKIDPPQHTHTHSQEPLGTNRTPNRGRNHRQWSFLFSTQRNAVMSGVSGAIPRVSGPATKTRSFRALAVRTIRTHIQSIRAPIEHNPLLVVDVPCTYLCLFHICTICLAFFIMVLQC